MSTSITSTKTTPTPSTAKQKRPPRPKKYVTNLDAATLNHYGMLPQVITQAHTNIPRDLLELMLTYCSTTQDELAGLCPFCAFASSKDVQNVHGYEIAPY